MIKNSGAVSRQLAARQVRYERVRDTVFIEGLVLHTVIGIHADEADKAQPVVVDLELGIEHLDAGETDQIADAIDYGAVRQRLVDLAACHGVKLLEAFAELIAETAMSEFGATRARVRVAKPKKFADVDACGVDIERRLQTSFERCQLGLV